MTLIILLVVLVGCLYLLGKYPKIKKEISIKKYNGNFLRMRITVNAAENKDLLRDCFLIGNQLQELSSFVAINFVDNENVVFQFFPKESEKEYIIKRFDLYFVEVEIEEVSESVFRKAIEESDL